tara:strand:+ start:292 stop:834 length:543 start_codon:yes stop_codon:yes gene_type:complete
MDIIENARKRLKEDVLEIENRTDLTQDQKSEKIIKIFSAICAAVAVQPIPFADIAILTPIQAYMGTRIAAVRGLKLSEQDSKKMLGDISITLGLGLVAQQIALGAYKVGLPFLAGFTTIPLVFGLTYGIGKVMDAYIKSKLRGVSLSPEQLKKIFEEEKKKGKEQGRKNKEAIKTKSKKL